MTISCIRIRGARTHNLKNINLDLPRNQLILITGLSGSGKSSLAFDTLYAEGQRRYVESLSAYARQFLSIMEKPEIDSIEGLSPAIAIQQKSTSHNPRSTVGTVTEIYDYLRVLFARVGEQHCPEHGCVLTAQTISQMADHILALPEGSRLLLLAPVVRQQKGQHSELLERLAASGYLRVRIDQEVIDLDPVPQIAAQHKHSIDVVVDRLSIRPGVRQRLTDSLATALKLSEGLVLIAQVDLKEELLFSARFACPHCDYSFLQLEPRLFSFNNPIGACPHCDGLGMEALFDPKKLMYPDKEELARYLSSQPCTVCKGTRLRKELHHVFIAQHSLPQLSSLALCQLHDFFKQLQLTGHRAEIALSLQKEIVNRLRFLIDVGLDYLSLDRRADSLSGGELQRIRLASQIGSGLVGVLYVLDEPSIGLHARDHERLLDTLFHLRDLGNTVLVVEHDEETIRRADYVVDIGPGAGVHGGFVIAQGSPEELLEQSGLTADYLTGRRSIAVPTQRVKPNSERMLRLVGADGHNLKNLMIEFPLGLMICITGVSGSGKSTLIYDTLYPAVAAHLHHTVHTQSRMYQTISGLDYLDKIIVIDQSPIGRTPRSNPATYTGLFTFIRELFAATIEARSRGYAVGRFSFNVKGGRCEACEGEGLIKIEMHFLADVYVSCDVCKGQRYNPETLEIYYKGKNIYEVLGMTVEEAQVFFSSIPTIMRVLESLTEVGLSYIRLGQSATTLSGGEAQRIKLAKELSKRATGKTLYLLDEPTTGLHIHDVAHLLVLMQRLRDKGNTVIVIEHHLDVIKTADWIIDLGPEGGVKGGALVCSGTPETVARCSQSHTGRFLRSKLMM